MKRILLLFFVLLICIPISGCFGPSNIQLFNETIESIRSFFSIEKYDDGRKEEREALEKNINKNLKNLGFDGEDGKVNINKEVIEEYLAEYSSDQLMASLYTLQLYLSEIDWSFYSIDHSWGCLLYTSARASSSEAMGKHQPMKRLFRSTSSIRLSRSTVRYPVMASFLQQPVEGFLPLAEDDAIPKALGRQGREGIGHLYVVQVDAAPLYQPTGIPAAFGQAG